MFRSSNSRESAATSENILKQLADYEVTILMDDSGSMYGAGWRQAKSVMEGVVEEAVKYDKNGIEIQFLNNPESRNIKTKQEVKQLFKEVEPRGLTPLGKRLGDLCSRYLHSLEKTGLKQKRCLIIVITDGAPNDKSEVYSAIKNTARRLDQLGAPFAQFGIQFVQIGKDSGAAAFLRELDDNLKGNMEGQVGRDIVDTVPYNGVHLTAKELVKILAGAINRRVDNQPKISERSLW